MHCPKEERILDLGVLGYFPFFSVGKTKRRTNLSKAWAEGVGPDVVVML